MSELFDLVAGTSTGSLLATALVIPNNDKTSLQKNKFFADKVIEVYQDKGAEVFTRFAITEKSRVLGALAFMILGAMIGYCMGVKMYHNKQFEEHMKMFKVLIRSRKQSIKGKNTLT